MSEAKQSESYPSSGYGWYVIGVLYLAYTLSFIDRQLLAFLVEPIRADFGISDFQFSLIQGLAFVIFYAALGIPIARLADSRNRRNIMSVGIGLWSIMTAMCGLAGNYWQLFLYRLGVGVGEASLSPSAISMIADYFPEKKRSLPINVYSAGVHGGAGMANIFGGLIVTYSVTGGAQSFAFLGDLKAWQMAFVLVGLPGLLIALLMMTVKEPERHEKIRPDSQPISFSETLSYLRRHSLVYGTLMLGAALAALASYSTFSWVPALYARRFEWSSAEIGMPFGIITFVFGTAGLIISGIIANRMVKANASAPYTKLMTVFMAGAILPAALLVVVNDPYWTLACLTLLTFCLSGPIGLVQTALQAITPNEMRAQVIAVYLLTVAIIGMGFGPTSVAAMTDYYYANDAAVGSSIAVVVSIAALLSTILHWVGIGAYKRKVDQSA